MFVENRGNGTLDQPDDVSLHGVRAQRLQHLHSQRQVQLLDQRVQRLRAAAQSEVVSLRRDDDHRLGRGDLVDDRDEGANRRRRVDGVAGEDEVHLRLGDHGRGLAPLRANQLGSSVKEEREMHLLTASTPQFTTMVGRVAFSRESSL